MGGWYLARANTAIITNVENNNDEPSFLDYRWGWSRADENDEEKMSIDSENKVIVAYDIRKLKSHKKFVAAAVEYFQDKI
jgi:hypothetical protein